MLLSPATIEISLDIEVEGEYTPADASVGPGDQYDAGPIVGLTYTHVRRFPLVDNNDCQIGWDSEVVGVTNLLEHVNTDHPEVRQLLANILRLYQTEADEALREANQ